MRLTSAPTSANRAEPTEQDSLQRCSRPANAWKQPAAPGWAWRPCCDRSGVRSDVTRSRRHCRRFVDTAPAVLDGHLRRCSLSWLGKGLSKPGLASSETLSHFSTRPVGGFLALLGPAVTSPTGKLATGDTRSLNNPCPVPDSTRFPPPPGNSKPPGGHTAQQFGPHLSALRVTRSHTQSPRDDRAARGPRHTLLFFAHTLDNPLLKLKYHIRITQCSHISEFAPLRDVPQQPTHDLS